MFDDTGAESNTGTRLNTHTLERGTSLNDPFGTQVPSLAQVPQLLVEALPAEGPAAEVPLAEGPVAWWLPAGEL